VRVSGRMGSSCTAGFDRYWRSLVGSSRRKKCDLGTGRAQAVTTKKLHDSLPWSVNEMRFRD
jgi:hypothetical protein